MAGYLSAFRMKNNWLPTYVALQASIIAVCLLFFQLSPPLPPQHYRLDIVEAELPAKEGMAWRQVQMPYFRESAKEDDPLAFRTHFNFTREADDPLWAVFLPGFTSSVTVSVNGVLMLDARRYPIARRADRNIPAMAIIPPALLREGDNEIRLELLTWGPLPGYLDSIYVGPDDALRPAYDTRIFLFNTTPLILAVLQGTLGIILGLLWLYRRHETAYGWFAGAMAIGVTQHFLALPVPEAVQGVLAACGPLETAMVLHFIAHFTQVKITPWGWFAFAPGLFMLVLGLFASSEDLWAAYIAVGPVSIGFLIIAGALILGWSAVRRHDRNSFFLGSTLTVLIVYWLHDMMIVLNLLDGERIFLGRLSYSTVLITIGIGVTGRFIQALNEADSFADKLVKRVREAEEKLRASFAREEEQARKEALAAERTRLMRDLHDGLGGQLVSIVALAEQMGQDGTTISTAARAALKDLRLVIDAMEEIDGDFMLALGSWRERILAQLRAHDVQLSWQVLTPGGLPVFPGLRPWHVIQIIRLLDEAVTNAIRHSGTKTLRVIIEAGSGEAGGGRIAIEDDGKGFDCSAASVPAPVQQRSGGVPSAVRKVLGRGLPNMKRRAALCSAQLTISSGPGGTSLNLFLPGTLGMSGEAEKNS